MTAADLLYYNEISTVVALTKKELSDADYPNLAKWFNTRISILPEVKELDR